MKKSFLKLFLLFTIISFLVTGCTTTSLINDILEYEFISLENQKILESKFTNTLEKPIILTDNFQPSKNTFYMEFSAEDLIFHLVAIKITPNTKFSILPENTYISEFSKINNATIAINGGPYNLYPPKPIGIAVQNGQLLSEPTEKYSAFTIDFKNVPEIFQNQFDINPTHMKVALGGFFTILKNGKNYGSFIDNKDSRTVIGISKEKDLIFLLVVEGEKHSKSNGLSYKECADLLLAINVENALQMDGGGSTSLYIANNNMLSYKTLRKTAINFSIIDEQ